MSGRSKEDLEGVSLLGSQKVSYPTDYAPEMLETFPNKHPENDYSRRSKRQKRSWNITV